jgi:RNA polymerase-binding transcription factor DksA
MADVDRERLVAERERLIDQVEALTADFDAIVASSELVSTDDEHDPDGSTVAFERQMVAGLLGEAKHQLDELDAAIARFDAGAYGRCETCGKSIAPARLDALPATTTCITCA